MAETKEIKKKAETIKTDTATSVEETSIDTKDLKKIYIGPNLLQLTTYTVVENEFPEHIKEVISKCSSIEKLFVNVTELAHYEKRAKTKGTLEYRNYIKVIEFAQGKGE